MRPSELLLAALPSLLLLTPRPAAQSGGVTIDWDDRGVPHVTASTDSGVFYGQGYASAVDGLAMMHRVRMSAQGRLAELVGDYPRSQVEGLTPLEQDLELRRVRLYFYAGKRLDKLDAATRRALDAFSEGVNEYIAELTATAQTEDIAPYLGGPLAQYADAIEAGTFEPWTPTDSVAAMDWWGYWPASGGASDAFAELEAPDAPQLVVFEDTAVLTDETQFDRLADAEAYAAFYGESDCNADRLDLSSSPPPQFSEGWAVSSGTAALIHGGPKLPILHPSLFHEVRLHNTSTSTGFNARGASLVGTPGILVGFSESVAWAPTSLDTDVSDLIRVELPTGPPFAYPAQYLLDGVSKPFLGHNETILVKNGTSLQKTFWRTSFGPVVTPLVAGTGEDEYVLSSIATKPLARHSIVASIRMLKARSAEEFREAAKYWTTPTFETVFADSAGKIGFALMAQIPTRSAGHTGEAPLLTGGDSETHWRRYVPHDYLPWTIDGDGGQLFVANNRPAGCWYPIPLNLGTSAEPTRRWLRLWQHFEDSVDPEFEADLTTIEGIAKIGYDPVNAGFELLLKAAVANYSDLSGRAQQVLQNQMIGSINVGLGSWLTEYEAKSIYQPLATADEDDDPLARLLATNLRFLPSQDLELGEVYGTGAGAALVMLRDLALNDFDFDDVDALYPNHRIADDILQYVDRLIDGMHVNDVTIEPKVVSDVIPDGLPYFGHADKFGGSIPSQDTAQDVDFATVLASDYRYRITYDKDTLWSAHSRSFGYNVDMSDPVNSGRGIHPVGNIEVFDHVLTSMGGLDGKDLADVLDVWWTGEPTGSTHYGDLQAMPLSGPGTPAYSKTLDEPELSYYGPDHGGWDPHRAPSIEITSEGPYLAGEPITLLVSNLPLARDFEIDTYGPPGFELEYEVVVSMDDAPIFDTASADPLILLVDQTDPVDAAVLSDVSDAAAVTFTLPDPLPAALYFQAVATLSNTPPPDATGGLDTVLPATTEVATMGLRLALP